MGTEVSFSGLLYLHTAYGLSTSKPQVFNSWSETCAAVYFQEWLSVSSGRPTDGRVANISYRSDYDATMYPFGGANNTVTTVPFTITSFVGDQMRLQMVLQGTTSATAYPGGSASAYLDAGHTGMLTLALTTPGASYSTLSGTDYTDFVYAPVPEPGTALLMPVGLAGLARVRRAAQPKPLSASVGV